MSNLVTKLVGELVSHRDHTIDHTEEACRTVLETMRQMLPLLLKKFLQSSSFRGDPVDQLCKLIGLLIEGDVCPHAIGIFDELKEVRGGECAGIESCQECSVCVCLCLRYALSARVACEWCGSSGTLVNRGRAGWGGIDPYNSAM